MFKHFCKFVISATINQKPHNWLRYIKSFILGLAHSKFSKVWATVIFFLNLSYAIHQGRCSPNVYRWILLAYHQIPAYHLIIQFHVPVMASHRQLPQRCYTGCTQQALLGDRARRAGGGGWEKRKARDHNPTEGIKVCKTAKRTFASLHDLS